jgi:hypothetical protein
MDSHRRGPIFTPPFDRNVPRLSGTETGIGKGNAGGEEVKRGCPIVGTATRRMILVGTVALFSMLLVPRAIAQIPNPDDVGDAADSATQGAQDAVDDVQDTADDATQGAQDAVDDVQDTADNATQGAQTTVEDTADDAGSAVPGSSGANARGTVKQLSAGERPSTTASDEEGAPADLAALVVAGQSIEGTIDASVDAGSSRSGPLDRAWDFLGLPMTGAELLAVVAVGVMFISAGAVLWRRARSRAVGGPGDGAIRHT